MEEASKQYYRCPFCETGYRVEGLSPGEKFVCGNCRQEVVIPAPPTRGPMSRLASRSLAFAALPFVCSWRAVRRAVDRILPENPAPDRAIPEKGPIAGKVGHVVRPMAPLMFSLIIHGIMMGVAATMYIAFIIYEEAMDVNIQIAPGEVMDLVYENPRELNRARRSEQNDDVRVTEMVQASGASPSEMAAIEEAFKAESRFESRRERQTEDCEESPDFQRRSFWVEPEQSFSESSSNVLRREKIDDSPVRRIMERVREVEQYYQRKIDRLVEAVEDPHMPPEPVRQSPRVDSQSASDYLQRVGRVKSCPASRIISSILSHPELTDDFVKSLIDEQRAEGGAAISEAEWRKIIQKARDLLVKPDEQKRIEEEYRAALAAYNRAKQESERGGEERKRRADAFRRAMEELTRMLVEDIRLSQGTTNYIIFRLLETVDDPAKFEEQIDAVDFEIDVRAMQMRCEGRVLSEADVHSVREAVKLAWKNLNHRMGAPTAGKDAKPADKPQ